MKPGSTFEQEDLGGVDTRLRTSTSGCSTPASSYRTQSLARIYRKHEAEKKRQYGERVREIEKGSFMPLIFSATGGAGPLATVFLKRLGELVSEKYDMPYSQAIGWL